MSVRPISQQKDLKLTANESHILEAYRALDLGCKGAALAVLRAWASDEPAAPPARSGIRLATTAGRRVAA